MVGHEARPARRCAGGWRASTQTTLIGGAFHSLDRPARATIDGMTGSRSLPLLRIFGIRVGVNYSWFLVLFVVIFVLWDSLSDTLAASETTVYVVAVVAAASFFASIVAHELGHALAARREGIAVEGIDLFLFGGVMKMSRDTDSPGAEFRVAVAGPLVTLLIMVLASIAAILLAGGDSFWDAARLSADAGASPVEVVVSLLVSMNLVLLLFNLVPAFPLDGGRIARAIAWKLTGDRHRATRFAARIGIGFGYLLIAGGLALVVFVEGAAFDGIWFAALGWLLASAARGTLAQTRFTEQLAGITVADVMDSEPVTIPAALPASSAYEDYFLRYQGWDWFAVVEDDGRYAGIAHRRAVEHAALQEGGEMPVRELAAPAADDGQVPADAPLEALLSSEPLRRLGALMAVDADGRLRGVVTFEQVTRALRARFAPS
jgi:Zn-dependent protease